MRSGASTPPDVPEPSAIDQTTAFTTSRSSADPPEDLSATEAVDRLVSDAEHARIDQAAEADARGRPAIGHHIQWTGSFCEEVLEDVDEARQDPGAEARDDADGERERRAPRSGSAACGASGKDRARLPSSGTRSAPADDRRDARPG